VLRARWFGPEFIPKLVAFCRRHYGMHVLQRLPRAPSTMGRFEAGKLVNNLSFCATHSATKAPYTQTVTHTHQRNNLFVAQTETCPGQRPDALNFAAGITRWTRCFRRPHPGNNSPGKSLKTKIGIESRPGIFKNIAVNNSARPHLAPIDLVRLTVSGAAPFLLWNSSPETAGYPTLAR